MITVNSYIRDGRDFIRKIRGRQSVPSNAVLVIADVVGPYNLQFSKIMDLKPLKNFI